jgi:hypothetical protein
VKRMGAASHPSRRPIPLSSQVCLEPEHGDEICDDQTFGVLLSLYCQVDEFNIRSTLESVEDRGTFESMDAIWYDMIDDIWMMTRTQYRVSCYQTILETACMSQGGGCTCIRTADPD